MFGGSLGLVFEDIGCVVFFVEVEEFCGVIVMFVSWIFYVLFFYVLFIIICFLWNVCFYGGEKVVYILCDDCVVVLRNVGGDDNDGEINFWEIGWIIYVKWKIKCVCIF